MTNSNKSSMIQNIAVIIAVLLMAFLVWKVVSYGDKLSSTPCELCEEYGYSCYKFENPFADVGINPFERENEREENIQD